MKMIKTISLVLVFLLVVIILYRINLIKVRAIGGIIYKTYDDGSIRYLLVTTKNGRKWIFPKGRAEIYESQVRTLEREIHEEAGVSAKMVFELEGNPYPHKKSSGRRERVYFYAMQYLHDDLEWRERDKRDRRWMTFDEAHAEIIPEFRQALEEAHNRLFKR